MGIPAQTKVDIKQFAGLITNADPLDLPPGNAQKQENVVGLRMGYLETRRGLRPLDFDTEDD